MVTKNWWIFLIFFFCFLISPNQATPESLKVPPEPLVKMPATDSSLMRCIAFSPYVEGYHAKNGPHPSAALIDSLLDVLLQQTEFNCILTYGFLNGLDYIIDTAHNRGMKVIANIWLEKDQNDASIAAGIAKAKQYPETITRLSCGSEMFTSHVNEDNKKVMEPIIQSLIQDCIDQLRNAGVTQPITSIETWWQWCNESYPCQTRTLADQVDWIGINVYPWWENKFSGYFPCTAAADAAEFQVARFENVQSVYPTKTILLTEFGWPAGPEGYSETNERTYQTCGLAGESNQKIVIKESLIRLRQAGIQGVLFSAFREPWKTEEGSVGPYWGICEGTFPFRCPYSYKMTPKLGIFRNGAWYLDNNGNRQWDDCTTDHCLGFGMTGDTPVVGDWDGSSRAKIGIFRNGIWVLDYNGNEQFDDCTTDHCLGFGMPGDTPVVGDWDGSGRSKIGIFRDGLWVLDYNGNEQFDDCTTDHCLGFGMPGDTPVVGDWDGSGTAKIGIFRDGLWVLDYNGNGQFDDCTTDICIGFGMTGDNPVTGAW